MKVDAETVEQYLDSFEGRDREQLDLLRRLVREVLPEAEETFAHGMPTYQRGGEMRAAFARQRNHLSLYVCRSDALRELGDRLPGASFGKGCIRFKPGTELPESEVREVLERQR